MEDILYDFNEKVISLMTDFFKNSIEVGGLSEFTSKLEECYIYIRRYRLQKKILFR